MSSEPWKGGMPLVPAWCIDHAESEVIWNGHHIPVAARAGEGLREALLSLRGHDPKQVQQALDYLDAVDQLDSDAARRISGLPLYSASPEYKAALMNVLANRASPPEYPGLALVPVPDLDRLAALSGPLSAALHPDTEPAKRWYARDIEVARHVRPEPGEPR